ncbi:MAG: urease accessory protein UreF [Burkholderiaceae bacterium]|nr:urease accessory protein UreF [Burkholderiaceae bacterium]
MATDAPRPDDGLAPWLPALMQLASPALPIGSFSYSQGLEAAAWAGLVVDEASALAWIDSHWRQSFAVRELPAVHDAARVLAAAPVTRGAHVDGADRGAESAGVARALTGPRSDGGDEAVLLDTLAAIDQQFMASRDSQEARAETRQVGAALLRWLGILHTDGLAHRLAKGVAARHAGVCAPTAFALCGHAQGLPPMATRFAWGFSWIENQVQAAVKIVPLGQSAGQRLLMNLRERLADPTDDQAWSFSPLASIMAMRHERQYTRLFRS